MKPFRPAGWCVVLFVALFGIGRAQPAAAEGAPPAKDLKVIVIDAVTQGPVRGAKVMMQAREPLNALTDEAGVVVLPLQREVPFAERDSRFAFTVVAPQYESRVVEWFADAGHVRKTIPAEYKVTLYSGRTMGGLVRDEKGAPIAGAKVILYASGMRPRTMGRGDTLQQDYGTLYTGDEEALLTDGEGRWRREHAPSEVRQATVDIIRPGGSRMRFSSGETLRAANDRSGVFELSQLFAQEAAFVLREGATVRGVVVDEAGKPVAGVQLRARDSATRNQPYVFSNNADGTFTLPNWDASNVLVTAEKEGYQAKSANLAVGGDGGPGRIVLAPAKPLRVRIVGVDGAPVADAQLRTDPNASVDHIISWQARTDAEGRAEWSSAPDKPVTLWIQPPISFGLPHATARLTATGAEHVVRLRPGADKAIQVRIRAVDAETGAVVPKFEVWRRVANQPLKLWGDPVEKGEALRELGGSELPNGWTPTYRLQVRAAGYTGWASEPLDFAAGDQDFTLKLVKGESTLANDTPGMRPGMGIDGERDPQLLVFGAKVARLLESGDAAAFVAEMRASLDDWKRALPAGTDEKVLPFGSDPTRIMAAREKAVATSAAHVLALANRAGVAPGKVRFTVKSISSPLNSQSTIRMAGLPVMMSSAMGLRVVLTGEPVDAADAKLRGTYELSIGQSRKFPTGWRSDEGVRWAAMPPGVGDEAVRRELALISRAAPINPMEQGGLSGMDDPALLKLGEHVIALAQRRSAEEFVSAVRLTREATADFYIKTDREVTPEVHETYTRISTGLTAAAQSMLELQEQMGVDLSDARLTVKRVVVDRPSFMRFGQLDGLSTMSLRVTFAAETSRKGKSGQPLAGDYTVAIGPAMRVGGRWVLVDDKIRYQDFPKGLAASDETKAIELENYVAEHRTLPPGHAAPDVSLVGIRDELPMALSAYRGKVVILEFWAVWCGPCQEPMAKLQQLRTANPEWGDRVEIVTVSIDEKIETARAHLEKNGWLNTRNMWAGVGAWNAMPAKSFRVRGVPTSYVIDRDGKIIKAGHPASMDFGRIVSDALKKPVM